MVPTTGDGGSDDAGADKASVAAAGETTKGSDENAESQKHQQQEQQQQQLRQLTGHRRLAAAWFGEDGAGSVPREQFAAFVRDLRLDVKTVECRLYSCAM